MYKRQGPVIHAVAFIILLVSNLFPGFVASGIQGQFFVSILSPLGPEWRDAHQLRGLPGPDQQRPMHDRNGGTRTAGERAEKKSWKEPSY